MSKKPPTIAIQPITLTIDDLANLAAREEPSHLSSARRKSILAKTAVIVAESTRKEAEARASYKVREAPLTVPVTRRRGRVTGNTPPHTHTLSDIRVARALEASLRGSNAALLRALCTKRAFLAQQPSQDLLQHICDRVRATLGYDSHTGAVTWRECMSGNVYKGDRAGRKRENFTVITLDGRSLITADVVYMILRGRYPLGTICHRDGNPLNNREANLYLEP